METTDFSSVLGVASGISASVVILCVAIALMARFRRHQRTQRNLTHHQTQNIQHAVGKNGKPNNHPHDMDVDPDIIINSQPVDDQVNHHQSIQRSHRNNNSTMSQQLQLSMAVDRAFPFNSSSHSHAEHYNPTGVCGTTDNIEIVTTKTPHRHKEVPETSI